MRDLVRNDILVRLRRVACCIVQRAESTSLGYINGIRPSFCDLQNLKLTIAMIEALKCYTPPITEVLAVGTVDITGTTGTIRILVNDIPLSDAITFNTSLTVTATAIADAATGYTVTSDVATLTITALANTGVKPNGYVISSINTGDMDIDNVVNLTGGVNGIVDDDNCFTLKRAGNMFNKLKAYTGISFAPDGATYTDPLVIANQEEALRTGTGEALTIGTAASPGEDLGFNIRNQELTN